MVILDTDVLTIVQRGRGPEYARLVQRLDGCGDEAAVTIISFEEQMRGWLAYLAGARTEQQQIAGYGRLRALLDDFQTRAVLDYDAAAAAAYRRLRQAKIRLGAMDLKIAAITLVHDALLISRNLADFAKVPGLRVEDWTATYTPRGQE